MPDPLPPGTLLRDRYEIGDALGAGDFGVVYLARDLKRTKTHPLGEGAGLVAIKQMPMQMIVDCERQADLRGALIHPCIPRIWGYFVEGQASYLVQEFIEGWNLEVVLNAQTAFLPESTVLDWAIQICGALEYLHTHPHHPILFRDMKPNNVMVTAQSRVYLVDFGLARAYPPRYFEQPLSQFAHLRRGLEMGTEGYSPPEQYQGFVTPQSDLYALGASLHHLLTRRDPRKEPPFTFDRYPLRALNPALSVELENIVMKAVQKDTARRFASAAEMKAALIQCRSALEGSKG
jgi:serine/threonine protein kinase